MMHRVWLVSLGFFASCSGQDQSLGETRPSPPAVIVPDPVLDPVPTPDPDPAPGPTPTVPPCEDRSLHARIGVCLAAVACPHSITNAGYECADDNVCCDHGVGAGQGGQTGDATAGAAGQP
jgi:hypothetical protein